MYNIGNTCVAQWFNSGGVAGEGVYISNPYAVVTNNIFHDISSAGASSGNAVWMNHCGVSHETIANNTMFNNGSGVAIDWAACSGPYAQPKADYITIANNIIVNNRAWGIVEHDYGCLFGTCQGVIGANNYYQNNLVYGNAGQQGGNTGVCSQIGDTRYNIVVFTGHCATNSLSVNPALGTLFINWQLDGSGDYHDKIGSPAIDAGEGIGGNSFVAPTIDFDGNTRSLGAGSIGAYEYVLAPNPPTALTVKVN